MVKWSAFSPSSSMIRVRIPLKLTVFSLKFVVKKDENKQKEAEFGPFKHNYFNSRDIYLNSYLVGEGLSGFVPAIAALIQGVGGNPECGNVTKVLPDGNVTVVTELVTPGRDELLLAD